MDTETIRNRMEHKVTIYDEINLSLYAQYQHMYQFFYQYRAISIGKKGKPIAFKRNVDVFRTILGQMLKQDIRIGNTPNILKVSLKMCLCYHVLIILSNGNALFDYINANNYFLNSKTYLEMLACCFNSSINSLGIRKIWNSFL